jgi:transposase-like protein
MSGKKRVKRTATDKLRVVVAGMDTSVNIAEMCRREGIGVTQFYGWKKKLLSSAKEVFEDKSKKKSREEEKLEAENRRLKEVIAEITSENLELKKGLSE